jgi:hypothetical protein
MWISSAWNMMEKDGHHSLKFGLQKINLHLTKGEFQPAALKPEYGAQDFCLIVEEDLAAIKKEIEQKQWPILEGIVKRNGAQGLDAKSLLARP